MKKFLGLLCLIHLALALNTFSQVRPVPKPGNETGDSAEKSVEIKPAEFANLPDSYEVKYQGGLFGFSKKQHGSIKFEDVNQRLVFYGRDGKEKFSIPYQALLVIYPSHTKVQAGSGRAVGAVPVPGSSVLGSLIKKKKNYLIVQFKDPDVDAEGRINFLLDTEEMLASAINSLGKRAAMKQRGDSFLRGKDY